MQRFHEGGWEGAGRVEVALRSGPVVHQKWQVWGKDH